jgi:hypothetical protein
MPGMQKKETEMNEEIRQMWPDVEWHVLVLYYGLACSD